MSSGSRLIAARKTKPATNAAMKPDPPSAHGDAVGEGGAGGGDHLAPGPRDQVPAAGVDDQDRRDQNPGGDSADDPEADLLEQKLRRASALGDVRLDIGRRYGREQERHADPVVEPALDVQALADPSRDARLGDDRLAERGVGRRQDDREDHGLARESTGRRSPPLRRLRGRSSVAGRCPADGPAPRSRAAAARSRCARRRRTGRAPASPRPALARSSSCSRCRFHRATSGPTRSPKETNRIAGVIAVPAIRFETAATAISASATIGSAHSIQAHLPCAVAARSETMPRTLADWFGPARRLGRRDHRADQPEER